MWDALLSAEAPPQIVGVDRRTTRFPLNATMRFADSTDALQLQLADLLAGAAMVGYTAVAGGPDKHPDYVKALRERLLLKPFVIGGVWPTPDVRPADLGTEGPIYEDAADYMAELIEKSKKKE
jgi:hypothetical protein